MLSCPNCHANNIEGSFFCAECGIALTSHSLSTRRVDPLNVPETQAWGTARFVDGVKLLFRIRDANATVELTVGEESLTMGRSMPGQGGKPDFDLSGYGGLQYGVSRFHAMIWRADHSLAVTDMGSTNGTWLNGQRLVAYQPHPIRDGDELRLGNLVLHVYFK